MDTIIRVWLTCDRGTQDYMQRRVAEGKSRREVRRSLKRYLARALFRQLNTVMA